MKREEELLWGYRKVGENGLCMEEGERGTVKSEG